ncbi:MAG: glycoside hydrolase family 65 protein [Anaerosomatales bacterium]
MSVWALTYEEYDPEQERLREALCTVGNGYLATRGAAPESTAGPQHYPGTYLGGYFNRLTSEINGREVANESMVNMPNWLPLTFRPSGGAWFDLDSGVYEILEYVQEFDLKRGVLTRRVRVRDTDGRTTAVTQRRFAHMGHRHLAGLETTVLAEDWSGTLEFRTAIDGTVANTGVDRYLDLPSVHLEPREEGFEGEISWLAVETNQSHLRVAEAVRIRVFDADDELIEPGLEYTTSPGHVECAFAVEAAEGEAITVEKIAAVFGSRDKAISEPLHEARTHVSRARSFDDLLVYHGLVWGQMWGRFETEVDPGDGDRVGMVLNLHVLHMLQTISHNSIDMDVGVPARGLHGEAYRGHIFWDEIFVFPLINFRLPSLTRALLAYRYRRLNEARFLAYQEGHAGALYPWQSGSNGAEETQTYHLNPMSGEWKPDNSHLQRHVNIAVAYNVWSYYLVTSDEEFLAYQGTEMLVEIARFWASLATYNKVTDRYDILGVMGPDEYHDGYPDADEPGLNNNAYTNVMAAWTLCRAQDALDALRPYRQEELWQRLGLSREEIEAWDEISRKLTVPFHDGVISQFEGYEDLEEFDWDGYREKYGDIQRLDRILHAEGDTPNRYKVSKQADVLMLFYLLSDERLAELFERLGYGCDQHVIHSTIDYYLARTSHGSTLSGIVHSWVIARRDRGHSWDLFVEALESDISDVQGGTTAEGIHLGAMAGTVDLLQRAYTGLNPREGVLWFDPALPDPVRELSITIRYHGMWLGVRFTKSKLVVTSDATDSGVCQIGVRDTLYDYEPGQTLEVSL